MQGWQYSWGKPHIKAFSQPSLRGVAKDCEKLLGVGLRLYALDVVTWSE
jgi:hypothetical protein